MALDQSALLELLEALKGADVEERVRQAAGTIYQALIEAELTAGNGPRRIGLQERAASARERPPLRPTSSRVSRTGEPRWSPHWACY